PYAAGAGSEEPLETIRAKDQVTIFAGTGLMSFTQVIVVEPIRATPARERPGNANFVQLLVTPLWIKQDDMLRPAFRVLRPRLNLSHGRVRRFVLTQRDGESVSSIEQTPRDAVYVLTIDLGHVVPRQLTIT